MARFRKVADERYTNIYQGDDSGDEFRDYVECLNTEQFMLKRNPHEVVYNIDLNREDQKKLSEACLPYLYLDTGDALNVCFPINPQTLSTPQRTCIIKTCLASCMQASDLSLRPHSAIEMNLDYVCPLAQLQLFPIGTSVLEYLLFIPFQFKFSNRQLVSTLNGADLLTHTPIIVALHILLWQVHATSNPLALSAASLLT